MDRIAGIRERNSTGHNEDVDHLLGVIDFLLSELKAARLEFEEGHRAWEESDEHKNADELRDVNDKLHDDIATLREKVEKWYCI